MTESAADVAQQVSIQLNGEQVTTAATTLLALVAERTGRDLGCDGRPMDGSRLGVAVAVDGAVVPRGSWVHTHLQEGAAVELVTAKQGG